MFIHQIKGCIDLNKPSLLCCAAYEGLYAGMPVFISTTSGVPDKLLEQPFVEPVPFNSTVEEFNAGLKRFMDTVHDNQFSAQKQHRITRFTKTALDPENVYWGICQQIGICGERDEDKQNSALMEDKEMPQHQTPSRNHSLAAENGQSRSNQGRFSSPSPSAMRLSLQLRNMGHPSHN
eukprot:scaffold412356_cov31-Prasinocladus_malaysianus.AAC.2